LRRQQPAAHQDVEGLWPSARSGCRRAPQFRGRSTSPGPRAVPDASWQSARNQPFSIASTYPTTIVVY
jgi:hypothetical protein